jgi:AraC family transcriptional regulator
MSDVASRLEPRIEQGRSMLIAGPSEYYSFDNRWKIPEQWQRFGPMIGTIPGEIAGTSFGVVSHAQGGFRYMTGVEVSGAPTLPAGVEQLAVPARRYAVFTHRGPLSRFPETLDFVWREWLPASGYRVDGEPGMIEVYDERFDPVAGAGEIDLWLPLRAGEA